MSKQSTYQEYRAAWENAYLHDPDVPLNIDLELASVCNLRCPSCFIPDPNFESFISQKAEDGKSLRRVIPVDLAYKIINEAASIGVPALKFNWRGESTLHPEYSKIVQYASNRNSFIELLANTNANCTDKAIDGLMACTKVMVSLDSMVPETYLKMRVGGKLDRAKEVIGELIHRGHPNLWIRRVLTKLNAHEPFFDQVHEAWGAKVKTSEHACFDRNETVNNEISGCDHDDMPRKYCGYPSQRLLITSAGYAYPCCLDLHETMRVGDFNKQSLLDIWNGDMMINLRKSLRSNDKSLMSDTCRNCQSWMAYDMPQRNWVQDRSDKIKIDHVFK